MADIKSRYDDTWRVARNSFGGFPVPNPTTSALAVSPEERRRRYDAAWEQGGLGFGFGTFGDLLLNREANDTAVGYIAERIGQIVHDPQVAERLTPRYPFFTKRPPLEHGYYETFNRPNVTLVDVRQSPIEAVTANAIRTRDAQYPVDCIVLATGFDAMTGALFDIDIRGRGGRALKDKWRDGPRTYLGLTAVGFPNLFMISGPQSPSVLTNMPVSIEQHVEWIADCIAYMDRHAIAAIEPTPQAEQGWLAHHQEVSNATLIPQTDSWWVGANVPGKQRLLYPYPGGLDVYRKICDQVAAAGYEGFSRTPAAV